MHTEAQYPARWKVPEECLLAYLLLASESCVLRERVREGESERESLRGRETGRERTRADKESEITLATLTSCFINTDAYLYTNQKA
jgi:hypothetical protein